MQAEQHGSAPNPAGALARFRRWAGIAVALSVVGFGAYAVATGWRDSQAALLGFRWPLYAPILLLTLVNYGLRYAKWTWYLAVLGIRIPTTANLWIFAAGLAMVISPGKAGELVKPYLVTEIHGAPMTKTIPALVAERATDGIAVVVLAAIGVSTHFAEATWFVYVTLAAVVASIVAVLVQPLGMGAIALFARLPWVGRFADRFETAYVSLRTCVSPVSLVVTLLMSIVAWWAECVGLWLVFRGLGADSSLGASTFLYAFATVFGAPMPGGMGMADGALITGAETLAHLTSSEAGAAALLIRVATLWFGVVLGAFALLRMEYVIARFRVAPQS